jgi:hypothetical protein
MRFLPLDVARCVRAVAGRLHPDPRGRSRCSFDRARSALGHEPRPPCWPVPIDLKQHQVNTTITRTTCTCRRSRPPRRVYQQPAPAAIDVEFWMTGAPEHPQPPPIRCAATRARCVCGDPCTWRGAKTLRIDWNGSAALFNHRPPGRPQRAAGDGAFTLYAIGPPGGDRVQHSTLRQGVLLIVLDAGV